MYIFVFLNEKCWLYTSAFIFVTLKVEAGALCMQGSQAPEPQPQSLKCVFKLQLKFSRKENASEVNYMQVFGVLLSKSSYLTFHP